MVALGVILVQMAAKRLACTFAVITIMVDFAIGFGGQPLRAGAASRPKLPPAHLHNGMCTVEGVPDPHFGTRPLVLGRHPTGLKAVWIPGLNATKCRVVVTHANRAALAGRLAEQIDHAPPHPQTEPVPACPFGDGLAVVLHFRYREGHSNGVVVDLNGCQWIYFGHSEVRAATEQIVAELKSIAPLAWRDYHPIR